MILGFLPATISGSERMALCSCYGWIAKHPPGILCKPYRSREAAEEWLEIPTEWTGAMDMLALFSRVHDTESGISESS